MKWASAIILIAVFIIQSNGLSVDPVASSDLEQVIKEDFVISLRHIRPRRKLQISLEALFMIDFPSAKHKFSFFLDRKSKKVTIDINSGSRVYSKHFNVESLTEDGVIRSVALMFKQGGVTLFLDCKKIGEQDLEADINRLYLNMEDPIVKIFRERKYPMHFDKTIADALFRANCQKSINRKDQHRKIKGMEIENQISESALGPEKNRKRDVRDWARGEERGFKNAHNAPGESSVLRRGDIPVIHGDCDDMMTRTLSELLALVKQLREEVGQQRNEISYLRQLIENCAGCKEQSAPLRDTCQSNPCYPGVSCYDTDTGPRCGHCPRGYIGDGKHCKPGQTCEEKPCFSGVQCYDTVEGAQCGPCPTGFEGDGKSCRRQDICNEQPCAPVWLLKRKHEHHIRTHVSHHNSP